MVKEEQQGYRIEEEKDRKFGANHVEGEKVKRYRTIKGLQYPHVELQATAVKIHLIDYLKKVTLSPKYEEQEGYALYISLKGEKGLIGILPKDKYALLLNPLFDSFERILRISDQEEYTGDDLQAFVPPSV